MTDAQERAAREALQQQLRQEAAPVSQSGIQQQILDQLASIRADASELQRNVRPAGRDGVRLSGSGNLQITEEDLARLRKLVPPDKLVGQASTETFLWSRLSLPFLRAKRGNVLYTICLPFLLRAKRGTFF